MMFFFGVNRGSCNKSLQRAVHSNGLYNLQWGQRERVVMLSMLVDVRMYVSTCYLSLQFKYGAYSKVNITFRIGRTQVRTLAK